MQNYLIFLIFCVHFGESIRKTSKRLATFNEILVYNTVAINTGKIE